MKKPLLFTALSTLILGLNAQITITNSNFLDVGEVFTQATDTVRVFSNIPSGANQTWNFSSLIPHNLTTTTGKDPATLPSAINHPTANFAIQQENTNDSTLIYLNRTNSIIESVGAEFSGLSTKYINALTFLEFPATYGSTYIDLAYNEIYLGQSFVYDSLRIENITISNFEVDAWGTLTTPLGTLPVIRLYKREIVRSTTYGQLQGSWLEINYSVDTSYRHTYFSNNPSTKFPVLEYNTDPTGTSTPYSNVTYLSSTQTPLTINPTKEALKFMVFPNPTTDVVQLLSATPIEQATLTDLNGKTVLSSTLNGNNTIQIGHLAQGTYTLSVLTNGSWSSQTVQKL